MPGRGLPRERFGAGVREIHTTYGGGLTVYAGHGSVATPGAFAAFGRAHERYGAAPWAELLAPAISAARDGFPLGAAAASYLELVHDSIFGWDEQTRAFHSADEGTPHPAGTTLRSPELADTLAHVAGRGWADLYTGDLAEQVVTDMARRGGLITAADLSSYVAARADRPAQHAARLVRRRQPAPVDRRTGADRDAADAGAARGPRAGRRDPDPARGARLPPGPPRRLRRPARGRPRPHPHGDRAEPRRAAHLLLDRPRVGRRQRRDGVRDHRLGRLRLRCHRPRHRAGAQQLPGRAGAQPAGAARPRPRHPPGLQHGADDRPAPGRGPPGGRQPGRRPHHHGADAGAGGVLPGRRRPAVGHRPATAARAVPRGRHRPDRARGRRHAARGGRALRPPGPRRTGTGTCSSAGWVRRCATPTAGSRPPATADGRPPPSSAEAAASRARPVDQAPPVPVDLQRDRPVRRRRPADPGPTPDERRPRRLQDLAVVHDEHGLAAVQVGELLQRGAAARPAAVPSAGPAGGVGGSVKVRDGTPRPSASAAETATAGAVVPPYTAATRRSRSRSASSATCASPPLAERVDTHHEERGGALQVAHSPTLGRHGWQDRSMSLRDLSDRELRRAGRRQVDGGRAGRAAGLGRRDGLRARRAGRRRAARRRRPRRGGLQPVRRPHRGRGGRWPRSPHDRWSLVPRPGARGPRRPTS